MVVSLIVDLVRGAPLIGSSIAGYNMVEGARYYGLGNELMGTMLGCAIIGVGMLLSSGRAAQFSPRLKTAAAAAVLCVVLLGIGAPMLGANTGGAIAAAFGIVAVFAARRGRPLSVRSAVLAGLVIVFVVGALFAVDALRGAGSQSHIGRTADIAASGDAQILFGIFQRKIALNLKLLSHSLWSRLLLIGLVGSALMWWQGKKVFGSGFLTKERSAAGIGCLVGTIAAFAFNDSGVLAAATCVVPLWSMLGIVILERSA